jgi:hypothetical protein
MPRWFRTFLHLTPVVAGTSLASVLGLLAVRELVGPGELASSSDAVGNYLQTVGGIYAVLLAFIVYVVWGQFNDARTYVDREATALVDLHRIASGLPTTTRIEIQRELRGYVDAVIADEWRAMAAGDEATMERIGERLEHVWVAIHSCEPCSDCQHTVYGEVLSRFNDLSDVRTSRLSSSRARIPIAMKILLYAGAFIMIGSMWLMSFDKLWLHATVTAALAGAVSHILFLIRDLDDAFAGDWQVSRAPFERARRAFERDTHQIEASAAA